MMLQRLVLLSMVVAGHFRCNLVEGVGWSVAPLVGRVGYIVQQVLKRCQL